jgi:hypothetical protein
MTNWLSELTNQHKELESPSSFWYWSAIAAISAIVKDQVWLDRQIYNLYPNIYVMLHAESGLKKGPPISMAKQLVKPVNNTRIISGRSSIQGILKDLGTAYTQPGGKVVTKSVAFICSSELSSSIVEDKVATKILTDLYDRQYNIGEWKSLLKMETFELKDPTITMLTATNEAMSEDFFSKSAIQGGYFARTFIIYEKERQAVNSLMYPLTSPPNYNTAADYLRAISKLNGPFKPTAKLDKDNEYRYKRIKHGREIYFDKVGAIYDDWYEEFVQRIKDQDAKDATGTLNRFGDSVLKVAMLLSLAREPKLELREDAMDEAIAECEKLLGGIGRATLGKSGVSTSAQLKTLIILELLNRENHTVSRPMLMKKMWMHYGNVAEFDDMMLTFHHNGMIQTYNQGNVVMYQMPDERAEEVKRLITAKQKKKESL